MQKVSYKGTVDGLDFEYQEGWLRFKCSPDRALRLMLGLEPQVEEPVRTVTANHRVTNTGWSAAEHGEYGTKIPDTTLPLSGAGGSAGTATRKDAVEEPSGSGLAGPAQPLVPDPTNVVPIKREDGLPAELAKSSTLKPVVLWYVKHKGVDLDKHEEALAIVMAAVADHPAAKRAAKDLEERVRLMLGMLRDGPRERA